MTEPMNRTFHNIKKCMAMAAMTALAFTASVSCSLMHDDLPECPEGVDLTFVYDYNVQRADMFRHHVGGVTVYVFDENGRYVTEKEEFNTASSSPLAAEGYKMHLSLPEGVYSFIAVAHQKGTGEINAAPGAKLRRTEFSAGHPKENLNIRLDRVNGRVEHQGVHLDTLWHGMSTTPVRITDMEQAEHTISLMRNTNNLTVSLHQLDNPAAISHDDFDVTITDRNGLLAHDNSLLDDEELTYTPYAAWTTDFDDGTPEGDTDTKAPGKGSRAIAERTAHYGIAFNRLMHYSDPADNDRNARLVIVSRKTGEQVAQINLPDCLAQGRGAFEFYNYTPQEFLDREYDYHLDFFLKDGTWQYARLSISLLSWSKRIQNVSL